MNQLVQGSPEWFAARLGIVTASRVADIIARTKSGYSTSRANYMAQLVAERLTGTVADSFVSPAMQWGTEQEPKARAAYTFFSNNEVSPVGFVPHPRIAMSGASPDGLIGSDGLVELKCPITATHIETLLEGRVPARYETQMLWQMACTGRSWCDFVSYDPRMPQEMSLFIQRVERSDDKISRLEEEVGAFIFELNHTCERLLSRYGFAVAA